VDEEDGVGTESESDGERGSRGSSSRHRRRQNVGQPQWMRLRNQDDVDDDDRHHDVDAFSDERSVGYRRHDVRLPADVVDDRPPSVPPADAARTDDVMLLMRPLVPAADAVVKATSSSFSRLHKSRSESRVSDFPINEGPLFTTPNTSRCRLTLSKSTANWTALYEPS